MWRPTTPIRSVASYVDFVSAFRRGFGGADERADLFRPYGETDRELGDRLGVWFRGQSRINWALLPSLHRLPRAESVGLADVEEFIIRQFSSLAVAQSGEQPRSRSEWMVTMQHYGAPTRLLDWTENALVALYLAARDDGEADGAVWGLLPFWFTTLAIDEEREPSVPVLPLLSDELLSHQQPFACRVNHRFLRASAQASCFTCHPVEQPVPLETYAAGRCLREHPVFQLVIARAAKPLLLDQLKLLGVSERTVFPDLDGLGRDIATSARSAFAGNATKKASTFSQVVREKLKLVHSRIAGRSR